MSKVIATRVDEADARALADAAKSRGLTASAWLRRMVEHQVAADRAAGRIE